MWLLNGILVVLLFSGVMSLVCVGYCLARIYMHYVSEKDAFNGGLGGGGGGGGTGGGVTGAEAGLTFQMQHLSPISNPNSSLLFPPSPSFVGGARSADDCPNIDDGGDDEEEFDDVVYRQEVLVATVPAAATTNDDDDEKEADSTV